VWEAALQTNCSSFRLSCSSQAALHCSFSNDDGAMADQCYMTGSLMQDSNYTDNLGGSSLKGPDIQWIITSAIFIFTMQTGKL
jgi:hypothetical protein